MSQWTTNPLGLKHFHQGRAKQNTANWELYCKGCVQHHLTPLKDARIGAVVDAATRLINEKEDFKLDPHSDQLNRSGKKKASAALLRKRRKEHDRRAKAGKDTVFPPQPPSKQLRHGVITGMPWSDKTRT
ncbi:hypothetical protein B0H10DRAFT_1969365 [Mycena sp. CBHHK59/15]|nr:hypothetical protein B0H10DRAFT_1969365 [Mycena sp. CBHHK59/15]